MIRHLRLVTADPTPEQAQNLICFLARFGSPLAKQLLGEATDHVDARRVEVNPPQRDPRRA